MAIEQNIIQRYNDAKEQYELYNVSVNPNGKYTVAGTEISATIFTKRKNEAKKKFDAISKIYNQQKKFIADWKKENIKLAGMISKGYTENDEYGNFQSKIDSNNLWITNAEQALNGTVEPVVSRDGVIVGKDGRPLNTKTMMGPYSPAMLQEAKDYVDKKLTTPISPTLQYLINEYIKSKKPGNESNIFNAPRQNLSSDRSSSAVETGATGATGTRGPTKPGLAQGDTTIKGGVNYTWNGTNWIKSGAVPFDRVESTFRKMFPSQAWLLDLDRTKYPKLFELIQRGVSGKMYETQQGLERFAAELKNTDFYTELATTDKIRQIKAVTGDLGFEGSNFNKFLTTSMNMGWEGETLKAETYKEVFRKDDAGNYINQTAVQRAKKSNEYLKVVNVGKAFFNTVSDATVESRLTGALNDEDIQRQQRELAKTKYAHLGNLIDQGFTLADLASGFQQQAAQLLEKDVNAIDMSQADFEAAYNYGDPGQKRMMTNGEWEIMLRTNSKFGWDKTNNAKAEARKLASSISQAFGKVI
jgi:hypothetical protein